MLLEYDPLKKNINLSPINRVEPTQNIKKIPPNKKKKTQKYQSHVVKIDNKTIKAIEDLDVV